jgi:hypothetical protein
VTDISPCPGIGKVIEFIRFSTITVDNRVDKTGLLITFTDDTQICISDTGQDCCESRYLTCDDDVQSFTGARFLGYDVLAAPTPTEHGEYGDEYHEVQFLHVRTDKGSLTCETHNEHNGYYGGISITVAEVSS